MVRDILLLAAIQTLSTDLLIELDLTSCLDNFEGGCASAEIEELTDGEFCAICAKRRDIETVDRLLEAMTG